MNRATIAVGVFVALLVLLAVAVAVVYRVPEQDVDPRLTLQHGEELELEPSGDLREENAGMLIFVDGEERPEYVPWADVEKVDFDRPPSTYPPLGR